MTGQTAGSDRLIVAAEREGQALELRKAGKTFAEIGADLGITKEGARQAVYRALGDLAESNLEAAAALRALESERLDKLLAAVWPAATAGDLDAVDRALKIAARRARLCGLDAPTKIQADVLAGPLRPTREQVIEAARRIAEREEAGKES